MISVIICSINPGKFMAVSKNFVSVLGGAPFEIIGIHDARSLCEGYNRGIAQSNGDILILCHDDIEIITPDFHSRLRQHLKKFDVIGCAGTTRIINSSWGHAGAPFIHGILADPLGSGNRFNLHVWGGTSQVVVDSIQALDGFFIAVNRRVIETIRFDEKSFDGFHVYDTDFTFSAYLSGFRLAVCKDILIIHQSRGNFDEVYQKYDARFLKKHHAHLPKQEPNDRKPQLLGSNLDRAAMLRLCEHLKLR